MTVNSYDVYDGFGPVMFTVKGRLSWGHRLELFDRNGDYAGTVREEALTFLPRFALDMGDANPGEVKKEFTFFRPVFTLCCNGRRVEGGVFQWNYQVTDAAGQTVMTASKELLNRTDTYAIDIENPMDTLTCLMIVPAIDAAQCSKGNS